MAPRKEFSSLSLVLTLVLFCGAAALALAAVNEITREPIAQAKKAKELEAISFVLPDYANDPYADVISVDLGEEGTARLYPARDEAGGLVGVAVITSAKGYGGDIRIMIGLDAMGKTHRIQVLEMKETPGLGDAIAKDKFLAPLLGQTADSMQWAVTKDGGAIDAVTAATISSRAAVEAVALSFEIVAKARAQGVLQ
jgi:H+/Na+-translocating ferredoxin:NAD+ oxidoreductase subunit G